MLSQKMQDAVNDQINAEMFSSYLYLSMSAYFEESNLSGAAAWMKMQAQEEMIHAMKFYSYILEQGGRVVLKAIDAPQTEWNSPLAAFEASLEHEKMVTGRINKLMALAKEENDFASEIFFQWFVTEQVEEESSVSSVVDKLKMVGDHPRGLYMLDRELAARGAAQGH